MTDKLTSLEIRKAIRKLRAGNDIYPEPGFAVHPRTFEMAKEFGYVNEDGSLNWHKMINGLTREELAQVAAVGYREWQREHPYGA